MCKIHCMNTNKEEIIKYPFRITSQAYARQVAMHSAPNAPRLTSKTQLYRSSIQICKFLKNIKREMDKCNLSFFILLATGLLCDYSI